MKGRKQFVLQRKFLFWWVDMFGCDDMEVVNQFISGGQHWLYGVSLRVRVDMFGLGDLPAATRAEKKSP